MKALKKDNFIFGFILGIIFPALLYGIIWITNFILMEMNVIRFPFDRETHILISSIANLLLVRYYFVNLKYDKTGRGVLIITFISIILFFILKDNILTY